MGVRVLLHLRGGVGKISTYVGFNVLSVPYKFGCCLYLTILKSLKSLVQWYLYVVSVYYFKRRVLGTTVYGVIDGKLGVTQS